MDRDDYRRESLEIWGEMASGWENWQGEMEDVSAPVREWLIRELAPKPGDTILELSAAAGETGFEAVRLVGDEGRLLSTDFSARMVEVARRRGAELGLANVDYRVIDAESIDLEDDSIEGVLCRFGYMLMADPGKALAETRRVLRPGGRLALAVWTAADRNPWASVAGRLLIEHGRMAPPEPGAPGIFALADEERLRSLLAGAGFTDVRTEEVPVRFMFDGADAYAAWATNTAGALAMVLRGLPADEREAIRQELERSFAPFAAGDGYEFPGVALCAVSS